ncbi:MAG: hypothetical protein KC549_04175 [Myxococcales bacterium]|nr:hypothetical protein [Myxococcales bacterium]
MDRDASNVIPDGEPPGLDAALAPDAAPHICRLATPTIQTAEVVSPVRMPVALLQERYEYLGLRVAVSEVMTPFGCCRRYATYSWDSVVEPPEHRTVMNVMEAFLNDDSPASGGSRDAVESPAASIFLQNAAAAPTRIGIVALVTATTGSDCPDGRATEELRSEPVWIEFAPSTFVEDGD